MESRPTSQNQPSQVSEVSNTVSNVDENQFVNAISEQVVFVKSHIFKLIFLWYLMSHIWFMFLQPINVLNEDENVAGIIDNMAVSWTFFFSILLKKCLLPLLLIYSIFWFFIGCNWRPLVRWLGAEFLDDIDTAIASASAQLSTGIGLNKDS